MFALPPKSAAIADNSPRFADRARLRTVLARNPSSRTASPVRRCTCQPLYCRHMYGAAECARLPEKMKTMSTLGAVPRRLYPKPRGGGVAFRASFTVLCGFVGSGIGSSGRSERANLATRPRGCCAWLASASRCPQASAAAGRF